MDLIASELSPLTLPVAATLTDRQIYEVYLLPRARRDDQGGRPAPSAFGDPPNQRRDDDGRFTDPDCPGFRFDGEVDDSEVEVGGRPVDPEALLRSLERSGAVPRGSVDRVIAERRAAEAARGKP